MSENKHTPEPWHADEKGYVWRRPVSDLYEHGGSVAGDKPLAVLNKGWHGDSETGYPVEANARRIVACVNACEGIPTDALEQAKDEGLIRTVRRRVNAEAQRDELLAALKKMYRAYVNLLESGHDRISSLGGDCDTVDYMAQGDCNLIDCRAAITSAEGGAALAPDADGWIEWKGGECPVADSTLVEVKFPCDCETLPAGMFHWDWHFDGHAGGDIIAYRVAQEGGSA